MQEAGDRRQYFRIDDEVDLYYRTIDPQQSPSNSQVTENILTDEALPQIMAATARDMHGLLKHIESTQPDIAAYLQLLNYKVDMLTDCVLRQHGHSSKHPPCQVNLSASGLAFASERELQYGEHLEMRIVLPASRALVTTCARVVQCRSNPDFDPKHPYLVSVVYLNMSEEDREVLIKHVIKRQMAQIRELQN